MSNRSQPGNESRLLISYPSSVAVSTNRVSWMITSPWSYHRYWTPIWLWTPCARTFLALFMTWRLPLTSVALTLAARATTCLLCAWPQWLVQRMKRPPSLQMVILLSLSCWRFGLICVNLFVKVRMSWSQKHSNATYHKRTPLGPKKEVSLHCRLPFRTGILQWSWQAKGQQGVSSHQRGLY